MGDGFSYKLLGVEEALKVLDPQKVAEAAKMALNTVARDTRVEASRQIRDIYNIKAGDVNKKLKVTVRASTYEMQAVISGLGMGLALSYFDAQQIMRSRMIKAGKGIDRHVLGVLVKGDVTARVKTGSGAKIVPSKYGNRPFIATMRSGHRGVWVRTGKVRSSPRYRGDQALEQLMGPGVGGAFGSRRVMDALQAYVSKKLPAEFNRVLGLKLKGQL